ncbi:Accessory colonization factor AcfD precursor [hydrothermal vent metagenome]|uniref:Accessory colonization factor AcfD n=2 Tax=hydrothermal vent metagenome TaxID=652676 RepID=A0A1W1C468_9ZZZZ
MKKSIIKLSIVTILVNTALYGAIDNSVDINMSELKSASIASDVDTQLEKIYNGVREFHIFKPMYTRWSGTDTYTTLVTGQNGFPVFSPRSDKDPKYTDYPIDYTTHTISRYRPVRPPESVKSYYTDNHIAFGDANTSTYNAPIVSAGIIGKGRVLVMGSHLYGSILVNPRNYSDNFRNNNHEIVDSIDMENFFHNVMAWLTEQNPNENLRYSKTGSSIPILSNKERTMFWAIGGWSYETDSAPFKLHDNFNITSGENPKLIPTWKEAKANGLLDPSIYPLVIMEDFRRVSSWTHYYKSTQRKTQLDEVDMLVDYVRAGGGLLIMDSPSFAEEEGVRKTASNEIMKKAGITTYFANNKADVKLLPNKTEVGGVHQFDMCLVDYIGHTDLQRRLGMDDYSNVPTTLEGLKSLLDSEGKISYLEEVLKRRERKIFKEGNSTTELTQTNCGTVEVELSDGTKSPVQTTLVKGDGIVQDGGNYDKYAKYPVDLNFVQAQGDVGGSMNTLLAHELNKKKLSEVDLNREYTNMSALLLNDAVFTGDKFKSLNDLLNEYKAGGRFVNANGEFYPGFSFSKKETLDFRRKPVTRIMVERAFYDKTLKYDPSEFPGQTVSTGGAESAKIYLKRNTSYQKWYAGNMQSTGLYAPAHQDVTITLPDGLDATKMQLQIGVGDNVGGIFRHEINLKRPPRYVKKYKFTSGNTLTVQHPYGGLIFLKSFDNSVAEDAEATISFTGVQKGIRFILGETTEAEWENMKSNPAPKAELESKHHIITVPRANMASLSFAEVTQIAKNYDQEAINAYDFYGYDRNCTLPYTEHTPPSCSNDKKLAHKNREVFDPHISVGAGHSGYPVMVMNWKPSKTTFPQDPTNSFLLWHEMGHNMVESWLTIPGSTEVANNVMAGHQQKRFNRTQKSIANVATVLAKEQPWADGGNAGRLMMFNQLPRWIDANYLTEFKAKNSKYYEDNGSVKAEYPFLDGDGLDVYKILHREARDRATENDKYDVCMKQSGKTKTDMLAICTSAILEVDTKSWLSAWKAGVVGIGAVDGVNIYDSEGGLSDDLDTGVTTSPSPSIEGFSGN